MVLFWHTPGRVLTAEDHPVALADCGSPAATGPGPVQGGMVLTDMAMTSL